MNQRLGGQQPLLTQQQIRERSDAILGQNLELNGELAQPDYVPHHIIPLDDGQVKAARDVKALFDHFFPPPSYQHLPLEQWPINQAFNGVWLRHNRLHLLQPKEMPASFTNHTDYYQALYERLKDQSNREDFLAELQQIKKDLSQHRFWDQNPSKLTEIENYRKEKMDEQQILAAYDAEMEAYLPEDLKELDQQPSPAEIEEAAADFGDILKTYELAKENKNPALFDPFLFKGLSSADTIAISPSYDISGLRKVLDKKGLLSYQQPVYLMDHNRLGQQNLLKKTHQRQRLHDTLQSESQRPFQATSFQKEPESGRSK